MGNALSLEGFLALRQLPLPPSHISAAVCIRIGALPASSGVRVPVRSFSFWDSCFKGYSHKHRYRYKTPGIGDALETQQKSALMT